MGVRQYRYGGTIKGALETLWSQGGIPRFYQGLSFALVQVRGVQSLLSANL